MNKLHLSLLLYFSVVASISSAESTSPTVFRAGICAKNIDPLVLPVWVNGGITGRQVDRIMDPLHARCLVLDDGTTKIAICIVDSCALPDALVTKAKDIVANTTQIAPDHILISATHTHSAPSVAGLHGTPPQDDYTELLPTLIAAGIVEAHQNLRPVKVGYTSTVADKFIYCRHWLMMPGKANSVDFSGRSDNLAQMNPGNGNPNKIHPVATVDPIIPILAIQTLDDKPLAVLASFCTHYAGAPAISADYFAVVAGQLALKLRPDSPNEFLGMMANGTSGDANCIDFSKDKREEFTHNDVGQYVANKIVDALEKITYQTSASLDAKLERLLVQARVPDEQETNRAKAYVAARFPDRLPKNTEENYARETVLLSELPTTRDLPLQVLRIGDFAITANPCESFNSTGIAIRNASPFSTTMNISLANAYYGYNPPPDQHVLGGYTAWRCRSSCLETEAEPKVVKKIAELMNDVYLRKQQATELPPAGQQANAMPVATKSIEKKSSTGPQSPVSPEDSLSWFRIDPRQKIELVANEPQVIDPVAMQFDDSGNIWIVEMGDYPNGPQENSKPIGRIRVLEDKDSDGRYETARTFADELLFANGLQLFRDGVILTAGDELRFLRDTDGDGRADKTETWIKGFADQNPQLRANDPTIALDLGLYVANGLRSATIQITNGQDSKASEMDLRGRDLRMDLNSHQFQSVTGPSQFGMTWDRLGNRYFCSNRNPCDSVLIEQSSITLSPLSGLTPMTIPVVPAGESSRVHPLTQAWTTSNLHSGQFSAACGVLMSASNQLPSASLGHSLTCEPTGNLIHRRAMRRVDGITSVDDPAPMHEWLASLDPWFRPVNLSEGPDAAIYVVDMHRAVIEHPQFMPVELKERPDGRFGDDRGRIYRVSAAYLGDSQSLFASLRASPIGKRSTAELIELLNHPNEWMRSTAARFLADLGRDSEAVATASNRAKVVEQVRRVIDPKTIQDVVELANKADRIETRLRAAYLLRHWGIIEQSHLAAWLNDGDSRMRIHAWKILLSLPAHHSDAQTVFRKEFENAFAASDREEAIQALWCLSATVEDSQEVASAKLDKDLLTACVQQVLQRSDNAHLWMAATAACRNQVGLFVLEYSQRVLSSTPNSELNPNALKTFSNVASVAMERLVPLVAATDSSEWIATRELISKAFLSSIADIDSNQARLSYALSVLRGWARSKDVSSLKKEDSVWDGIVRLAENRATDRSIRLSAIGLLGYSSSMHSTKLLQEIANESLEPEVFGAVIQAWSKHADPSFENWLIERFASSSVRQRAELFNAFLTSPKRSEVLVKSLEEKKILMRSLSASQLQSLKTMRVPPLRPRIDALIANSVDANRAKVIESYVPCLEMPPDVDRGRQVFLAQCAACHRIDNIGINVGPDISDPRNQTPSMILTSILDPNRAIDNNYFRFSALTIDGQVIEGILTEETATTVTLKSQNSRQTVLQRAEIESFKSTGISMMPEGLEAQIPPQAMADLIHYIKNWRYADAKIPVSKGKAE